MLPQDVQNQLNDLMASLEDQKAQDPQPTAPEQFVTELVSEQPVAAQPVPQAAIPQPVAETQAVVKPVVEVQPVVEQPVAAEPVESQAVAVVPPAQEETSPVVAAPEAAAEKKSADNRSVAEILGAMGMAVPGDDVDQSAAAASPAPMAPPVAAPPVANPAEPAPAVFQAAANNETQSGGANSAEDDIQAYMNRLLNKTGDEAQATPTDAGTATAAVATPPAPTVNVYTETAAAAETVPEPVAPLSADEFVPNHKASRPKNYDALREIANTSSRSAVRRSNEKEKKENTLYRLICLGVSLLVAAVMFCFQLHAAGIALLALAALSFAIIYRSAKSDTQAVNTLVDDFNNQTPS